MKLELRLLKRRFKFLFQRLIRGFDDSETWDLQDTFHRWLLPRLERFLEVTCAYPMRCKSHQQWIKELNKRVHQLDCIVNINEFEFQDRSYIPKDIYKKWIEKGVGNSSINAGAYDYCVADFDKWFGKHIGELWW